ncbi:homoserine acetyltransferase [Apiospora hydei]|uniref:Homoserine acetyltransferase n=1 Tax=Apiospora hydei TaxID=1337664 RepID=A0ABR1WY52_9PEZI
MPETKYFHKGLTLSARSEPAGKEFPAKLAYWTFGSPSNPAVLMPTCFGGDLEGTMPFLYSNEDGNSDPPFPPEKFFVIVVGLMGGGESSSPSNQPPPFDGTRFPKLSYEDNIRLQYAFCTEELGISKIFTYIGFSMGGQQAYHIATLYPDFVENIVGLATSARTSWHNWSFLEGPKHALITAHDFHGGSYEKPAVDGVKAFKRVYATWALSQGWFRQQCWKEAGFDTLQDYLKARWTIGPDANDLLAMLWTWQKGDISLLHPEDGGDLAKTLSNIKARCLIMPSRTDQYFPPEDNEEEVKHLKNGELAVIETVWGHFAGGGIGSKQDTEFIKKVVRRFLKL